MPLQELSPLPAVTGYSALGAVAAQAGNNARERSQQLQDVASQRAWLEREGDKQRAEKLQDEQTLETFRNRLAGIQILINEGYLDGSKRNDPNAVAQAYQRAQADGVDKLYTELTNTPDEGGKPLLTHADLSNPAAVQSAKDKLGAIKAKQLQFQMGQPANAQATVDSLSQQLATHQARIAQISAKLDEPAKQYGFNDPQVQALAVQLAEQAKPGSGRNREAVGQMLPIAQKQLNDQATLQHMQDVQAATRQLDGERYAEASITQALDHAMQTSKVFPIKSAGLTPAMLQAPAAPAAPKVASASDIANAMKSIVGGTPAAPAAAPATSSMLTPIENPTNDPTIDAGNSEIKRRQAAAVQSQLNDAINEGKSIDQQLDDARQGYYTSPFDNMNEIPMGPQKISPIMAAHSAASLLKAKADNAAKVKALQSQLMGPAPAIVTPPAVNTPTTSTPSVGAAQGAPNWWQTSQPPGLQ